MLWINGKLYDPDYFPDNSIHMLLDVPPTETIEIMWKYSGDFDMPILYYMVQHIRQHGYPVINLRLPYIPHARMDRVKSKEEVFTLKHFCNFINMLMFDHVYIVDPHSSVCMGLLDRVEEVDIRPILNDVVSKDTPDFIFYPDNGSYKRYSELIKFPNVVYGHKDRDWSTGKILGLDIIGGNKLPEKFNVLIVDDICSYGGTIYYSALELKKRGAQNISVYITHAEKNIVLGSFGKNNQNLVDVKYEGKPLVNHFYTTDSLFNIRDLDIFQRKIFTFYTLNGLNPNFVNTVEV